MIFCLSIRQTVGAAAVARCGSVEFCRRRWHETPQLIADLPSKPPQCTERGTTADVYREGPLIPVLSKNYIRTLQTGQNGNSHIPAEAVDRPLNRRIPI